MKALLVTSVVAIATCVWAETPTVEGVVFHEYDGGFDDAQSSLTSAIEAQGLKVDHISHVGDMLARTAEDVGATTEIYENAEVVQFCSATLSREMMEINPANVALCPYMIFVYQAKDDENAIIGYRNMPAGEMQKVETLLATIVDEALAF